MKRPAPVARVKATSGERAPSRPRTTPADAPLADRQVQPPVHQFASLSLERPSIAAAPPPNRTGLPDRLKAGIEQLSGFAMDDVRVHYNSPKPATLQALAYTKGTEIHIGPGQETHLPHEAWHVVQQAQGRVKPTLQLKGVAINDDAALEREADAMRGHVVAKTSMREQVAKAGSPGGVIQRKPFVYDPEQNKKVDIGNMSLAELKHLAARLPYQLSDPVDKRIERLERREEKQAPPSTAASVGRMMQHGTKASEYDIKADTKETEGLITTAADYRSSATNAVTSAGKSMAAAAASVATGGISGHVLTLWNTLKSGALAKQFKDLAHQAQKAANSSHDQQERESKAPGDLIGALEVLGAATTEQAFLQLTGVLVPGLASLGEWFRKETIKSAVTTLQTYQGKNGLADQALGLLGGTDMMMVAIKETGGQYGSLAS